MHKNGTVFADNRGMEFRKTGRKATRAANIFKYTLRGSGGFLLTALLLIALRVSAQNNCDPAPSGLISWWPGDGNANDIASTNNGTLQAGATDNAPGFDGDAFVFDGTNAFVAIPDAPSLHPTNLTIEAWVRCDLLDTPSINSYPGQQYIIFHQNAEMYGFEGFDLAKDRRPIGIATNDTWCFEVTSTTGTNIFIESLTNVITNVWYHLAGVRGSNYIALYVNGVLQGETNVGFPVGYGDEPFYFATTGQPYYDHKFGGALDEIALFDRDLSSNEIYAIYAAGHDGKCKTPTALSLLLSHVSPQPTLTVGGLTGQAYGIQSASALTGSSNDWIGLTNQTLPASTNVWVDPAPGTNAQKFYRVLPGTISVP